MEVVKLLIMFCVQFSLTVIVQEQLSRDLLQSEHLPVAPGTEGSPAVSLIQRTQQAVDTLGGGGGERGRELFR